MVEQQYADLATELERDISTGRYGWDGGLPTVRELAHEWHHSVGTIRAALLILHGRGIVEKRGAGWYVKRIPYTMTEGSPSAYARIEKAYYENIGTVKRVHVPEHLAKKLGLTQLGLAVYRVQLSGEIAEGEKVPLQISYRYHLMPVSDDDLKRMAEDAAYDPFWDNDGVPNEPLSHDETSARLATEDERELLNLSDPSAVLHAFESIRDNSNNVLYVQELVIHSRETLVFDFAFKHRSS